DPHLKAHPGEAQAVRAPQSYDPLGLSSLLPADCPRDLLPGNAPDGPEPKGGPRGPRGAQERRVGPDLLAQPHGRHDPSQCEPIDPKDLVHDQADGSAEGSSDDLLRLAQSCDRRPASPGSSGERWSSGLATSTRW